MKCEVAIRGRHVLCRRRAVFSIETPGGVLRVCGRHISAAVRLLQERRPPLVKVEPIFEREDVA
jgi:hypothetical protein